MVRTARVPESRLLHGSEFAFILWATARRRRSYEERQGGWENGLAQIGTDEFNQPCRQAPLLLHLSSFIFLDGAACQSSLASSRITDWDVQWQCCVDFQGHSIVNQNKYLAAGKQMTRPHAVWPRAPRPPLHALPWLAQSGTDESQPSMPASAGAASPHLVHLP